MSGRKKPWTSFGHYYYYFSQDDGHEAEHEERHSSGEDNRRGRSTGRRIKRVRGYSRFPTDIPRNNLSATGPESLSRRRHSRSNSSSFGLDSDRFEQKFLPIIPRLGSIFVPEKSNPNDFSVTVDKRPRNDIGQLNPINFGRGVFAYMSSFHNRTAVEMWTRYTNFITANYGDSTGVLIQELSLLTFQMFGNLPDALKFQLSNFLNQINYATVQLGSANDFARNITQAVEHSDKSQIKQFEDTFKKQFLPLAERLFFNPFDDRNLTKDNSYVLNFTMFC